MSHLPRQKNLPRQDHSHEAEQSARNCVEHGLLPVAGVVQEAGKIAPRMAMKQAHRRRVESPVEEDIEPAGVLSAGDQALDQDVFQVVKLLTFSFNNQRERRQ